MGEMEQKLTLCVCGYEVDVDSIMAAAQGVCPHCNGWFEEYEPPAKEKEKEMKDKNNEVK